MISAHDQRTLQRNLPPLLGVVAAASWTSRALAAPGGPLAGRAR